MEMRSVVLHKPVGKIFLFIARHLKHIISDLKRLAADCRDNHPFQVVFDEKMIHLMSRSLVITTKARREK